MTYIKSARNIEIQFANFFLARWMRDGLSLESYLTVCALSYGILLIYTPDIAYASRATVDIVPQWGKWLGALPLLAGFLMATGLVFHTYNSDWSKLFRFSGALLSWMIWAFLGFKFLAVEAFGAVGVIFCLPLVSYFLIRIMIMSLAGIPRPLIALTPIGEESDDLVD